MPAPLLFGTPGGSLLGRLAAWHPARSLVRAAVLASLLFCAACGAQSSGPPLTDPASTRRPAATRAAPALPSPTAQASPTQPPPAAPIATAPPSPVVLPTAIPPATAPEPALTLPTGAVPVELVQVIDGDTIDVRMAGTVERVRYVGIDAPERSQLGYQAATEANRALLGAGPLYLVRDVSERDSMANPRLLRYVYRADGTHVNAALVADGWAQPVAYPPDVRHAGELRALAVQAAREGRGFWAADPPAGGAMSYGVTTAAARIRQGPGTEFTVTATTEPDTPLTVFGRTPAGDWLQVRAPDRTGGWMAAELVRLNVAVTAVPVAAEIPAPPAAAPTAEPAAAQPPLALVSTGGLQGITLTVVRNAGQEEILELRNGGAAAVDVSGWELRGDKGDDRCVLPGGTVLGPGAAFQVATGDAVPAGPGYKCGERPIWNNEGETIFLRTLAGEEQQIQVGRVR